MTRQKDLVCKGCRRRLSSSLDNRTSCFCQRNLISYSENDWEKYDVQILIQSRKMNTEYFSGSIDADLTLDEILSYLDVDNKFVWRRKGKTVVIADR